MEELKEFREEFLSNQTNVAMMNVYSSNVIPDMDLNREEINKLDHHMSNTISVESKASNQKSTGRCWLFAGLNTMRINAIKKYDLPKSFEFSQSYLFFWDKFERSKLFLNQMYDFQNIPHSDRGLNHIVTDLLGDGGQWDMFTNLLDKYGTIPKTLYNESHNSSASRSMNGKLKTKLREYMFIIRREKESNQFNPNNKDDCINQMMKEVFHLLVTFMGVPPLPDDELTWKYSDKNDKVSSINFTPLQFYSSEQHLNLNLSRDYVCVVNDPRKEHLIEKTYTVQHLGNVMGKCGSRYLNMNMDSLLTFTKLSINDDKPVWFGANMGSDRSAEHCLMSTTVHQPEKSLCMTFNSMTKEEKLVSWEAIMTHAMVFTGYDEENAGTLSRLRVENSWGDKGSQNGYYTMTKEWFNNYVFEVAIHKKFLTPELIKIYDESTPSQLPAWDQMGSLASY